MRFQVSKVQTGIAYKADLQLFIEHPQQIRHLQDILISQSSVFITKDVPPNKAQSTIELNIESVGEISALNAASSYQAIPITVYCVARYAKRLKQELMSIGSIFVPVSHELAEETKAKTGGEMPLMVIPSEGKPEKEKSKQIDLRTEFDKTSIQLAQHIGLLTNERKKNQQLQAQLDAAQREISRVVQERNKACEEVGRLAQETQLAEYFVNQLCQILEDKELKEPRGNEACRFNLLEVD